MELPDGDFVDLAHLGGNRDGRLERKESQTDWARVDAMTDEDIEAAIRDDPDWADLMDIDWSKAELLYPVRKRPDSIRLDEDVIAHFRNMGRGYQTRIDAVLHSYMNHFLRGGN